jgi:hypothetical protein
LSFAKRAMAYLIPCQQCQQTIRAELGMAGETVRCPCGGAVEIPVLRLLRTMPRDDEVAPPDHWTLRQSALSLGLIIAILGIVLGLYQYIQRQRNMPEFVWKQRIFDLTNSDVMKTWRVLLRDGITGPNATRSPETHEHYRNYLKYLSHQFQEFDKRTATNDQRRPWENTGWIIAVLGVLTMIATNFMPANFKFDSGHMQGIDMKPGRPRK